MSSSKKNFWKEAEKPMNILAPMAGYTDSAFRLLCKKFGADVVITELISADAVAYSRFKVRKTATRTIASSNRNKTTAEMLSFYEAERPIVVQLFGKNPENFAKAARWITENLKPDGIDINMGCPARKVVGSDHGAALLKKPDLAVEIVRAVKENTNLPVSVKTRLGWSDDDEILQFAPKLINAGIDALIVHGRTYKDGFKGKARWENIYKIKKSVKNKVVVIGNGDIEDIKDSKSRTNNLDGVAIGRATYGSPWVFDENLSIDIKEIILEHAKLAYETKGAKGIIEFRKHLLSYIKNFPNAKKIRLEAVKVENLRDVESMIRQISLK